MKRVERLGSYELEVWDGVFPLGGDSLALGEFSTVKQGWRVCDLGTGSGVLLLLLAERAQQLALHGVEQSPQAAENARYNLAQNGLAGEIVTGDMGESIFPAGSFDLVVSNPPYFPAGSGRAGSGVRHEGDCTLEQLCAAGARLLKNGGRFALCHRPERLVDLLCAMRRSGLEPKRLKLLAHGEEKTPSTILAEGVRLGKPGLAVLPVALTHPLLKK